VEVVVRRSSQQLTRRGADVLGRDQLVVDEPVGEGVLERVEDRLGSRLDPPSRLLLGLRLLVLAGLGERTVFRGALQVLEELTPVVEGEAGQVLRRVPAPLAAELVHPLEQRGVGAEHLPQ